jgi:hypothetical protein
MSARRSAAYQRDREESLDGAGTLGHALQGVIGHGAVVDPRILDLIETGHEAIAEGHVAGRAFDTHNDGLDVLGKLAGPYERIGVKYTPVDAPRFAPAKAPVSDELLIVARRSPVVNL